KLRAPNEKSQGSKEHTIRNTRAGTPEMGSAGRTNYTKNPQDRVLSDGKGQIRRSRDAPLRRARARNLGQPTSRYHQANRACGFERERDKRQIVLRRRERRQRAATFVGIED